MENLKGGASVAGGWKYTAGREQPIGGLVRLGLCLLLIVGVAEAAAPPLGPDEVVLKTLDGCGKVIAREAAKHAGRYLGDAAWSGACVDGLAMGEGVIFPGMKMPGQPASEPLSGWMWYGRAFGPTTTRYSNGATMEVFHWDGRTLAYNTQDADHATWSKEPHRNSYVTDGDFIVMTQMSGDPAVYWYDKKESRSGTVPCPNKSSAEGCEAVWARHAGPVIERIRTFVAEHEPKAAQRRAEVTQLVAKWKAQVGPKEVARREAAAQRLNRSAREQAEQRLAAEAACMDAANEASAAYGRKAMFDPAATERYARALQHIYRVQCPDHFLAKQQLEHADWLMQQVPQEKAYAAQEAARHAQASQAQSQQQARDDGNNEQLLSAIGQIATAVVTYQAAKNAASQAAPVYTPPPAAHAPPPPPQRTASSAPVQSGQRREGESASHCLAIEVQGQTVGLRNKCGYDVEFDFCVIGADPSSFSEGNGCHRTAISQRLVKAGQWSGGQMQGTGVHWVACKAPSAPVGNHFDPAANGFVNTRCSAY